MFVSSFNMLLEALSFLHFYVMPDPSNSIYFIYYLQVIRQLDKIKISFGMKKNTPVWPVSILL